MYGKFKDHLTTELQNIREAGLYKNERVITSPQGATIEVQGGKKVLNFCANNYLGLSSHPEVIAAAKQSYDQWGYGLSSVRFICGTQKIHKLLEEKISHFLGMEDTILYGSCFDANGGLFETLMLEQDAIISDELNHASIIDGIRLAKAKRFRYKNNNMEDLEAQLKLADAEGVRFKLIATDGVFSMDGYIANLKGICDLADKYNALVMVDDSHAVGFMGEHGRGTHEHCAVMGRVDIITGTLGKALGGASGGYISAKKEIIELLRQRSRPYLFSNTLAPAIVASSLAVLDMLSSNNNLIKKLKSNTAYFREAMTKAGFNILPGEHPICPLMLGDAKLASKMADRMLEKGVYVIGFSFPVVPKDKARIRVQISAGHSLDDIKYAIEKFIEVKKELLIT
jgi:glycine C-acetyltransferase